ncbi:DUF4012 domain-containing protein [Candidatus Uhrbacteria bacterium]|jgi:hypothetical protein|nr:DUF4012 domain-containing protein [Candidatus Uhrbacteria bacterium]MBT7716927.1 DUF4012 domain-containing protein [Candidatus Uhrbacteria bacterium]
MSKGLNFLQEPDALGGPEVDTEPMISYQPPKRPSIVKKVSVGVVATVLIIGCLIFLISVGRLVSAGLTAKSSLEYAQDYALEFDFENAQKEVRIAGEALETARSSLWFAKLAYPLPYVGDQAEALVVLVDTGVTLVGVMDDSLSIVQDVYASMFEVQEALGEVSGLDKEYTFETLPSDVRVQMLQTFKNIAPDLAQASVQLEIAQEKLSVLEGQDLFGDIDIVVAQLQEVLPQISSAVNLITPFAQSIEEIAGVDQDRQWLLIFLNNTEMRPGGGFMGVYGLLQVRDGEIIDINTADTYSIDRLAEGDDYVVVPPYPIEAYLGLDTWYFRDANWYPDFAESSKTAVQLLRQEYAYSGQPVPEVHGVIGFTPTVIEMLLEVIGDVTVDGITFTSETFTETLEYDVEYGFKDRGVAWDDRKAIINDLVDELIGSLMSISVSELPNLVDAFAEMFIQKQIALYSFDAQTQVVFEDAAWSGTIDIDNHDDFLIVADANMGALKTDHAMEKEIAYSIIPNDDGYLAQVDITYYHNGGFDWRTTRYQSYTSILAPIGSELIYTSGESASSYDELGMSRFGSYISIEPGEIGTLSFTYQLPSSVASSINSGSYDLAVFKQIGSKQATLTLDLDFDKNLRAAQPSELEDQYGDQTYHVDAQLNRDLEFIVQF